MYVLQTMLLGPGVLTRGSHVDTTWVWCEIHVGSFMQHSRHARDE